jgi:hypothetical protein
MIKEALFVMSNIIIHPTRANITLFQGDLLRAGDDER